ncbi:group II intron maturase-specific domain-containing protein [Nocardia gamkensis]
MIRGWTAYHRPVVASEAFAKLDNHLMAAHIPMGTASPSA